MSPEDFTAVTTEAKRKRHWSLTRDMQRDDNFARRQYWHREPGLSGYTLCGGYRSRDQERLNHEIAMWSSGPAPTINDLPPCKQCDKSRQRRIDGRPS